MATVEDEKRIEAERLEMTTRVQSDVQLVKQNSKAFNVSAIDIFIRDAVVMVVLSLIHTDMLY